MPEINLPTAGKQDTILANTNAINANVNANKSTLATVNANLGTPTSGANSSTSANAHAKLNYINGMLGTINSNVNAGNRHAGVYKQGPYTISNNPRIALDIKGKGVLRTIRTFSPYITVVIDEVSVIGGNTIALEGVTFPFNSSLQIQSSSSTPDGLTWLYELY